MFQPVSKPIKITDVTESLTPAERAAITNSFSKLYSKQVLVWAAQQKNKKRNLLQQMLSMNGSPSRKSLPVAVNPSDLVLKTLTSCINFNYSFRDRPCSKRTNREKFSSHGIRDEGIFGFVEPIESKPTVKQSYASFIAKKLLTPEAAEKVCPIADDYFDILKEIQDVVERKSNFTAVSLYSEPDSIKSTTAYADNRIKYREDHVGKTGTYCKSQAAEPEKLYHPPTTSYSDFFNKEKQITSTRPFRPQELSVPFSRFSTSSMGSRSCETFTISEEPVINENQNASKRFRSIFESKTVL